MPFTSLGVLRILMGVGQGYRDETTLVGSESGAVYIRHAPEEISAACLGKSLDPSPDTSTMNSSSSTPNFTALERDLG
jgi:hypothetical protein